MRMLHLFALIVSLHQFACVAGDNETDDGSVELDGMFAEDDSELPGSYDLVAEEADELPALEHAQRPDDASITRAPLPALEHEPRAEDATVTRASRPALETRSVQRW